MGSGVKGQEVGTILGGQVPGPSFSIRGRRRSDAIPSDPGTDLDSADGAVACAGERRSGAAQMDFRRGLCSVRPAATEART